MMNTTDASIPTDEEMEGLVALPSPAQANKTAIATRTAIVTKAATLANSRRFILCLSFAAGMALIALLHSFVATPNSTNHCLEEQVGTFNRIIVQDKSQQQVDDEQRSANGRFIFHIGIEGTGHHLLSGLLPSSPILKGLPQPVLDSLGKLKSLMGPVLSKTDCYSDIGHAKDTQKQFDALVKAFQEADAHLSKAMSDLTDIQTPIPLPLNAFRRSGNQQSYPMSADPRCRALIFPDMDMLYAACDAAGVLCSHVYLYRDPYQVVKSSTHKRGFNRNVVEASKLYYTMLNVIFGQLAAHGHGRTMGCWNLLKPQNNSLAFDEEFSDTWDTMRDLYWGPENKDSFDKAFQDTMHFHDPPNDLEAYQRSVIPTNQQVMMDSMVSAHERTLELCRLMEKSNRAA